jgi:hypothetical protein
MRADAHGKHIFAQTHSTSKFHEVKLAHAGDAKVWVKAAS